MRSRRVFLLRRNLPRRDFPQISVKPRKVKVSGLPGPRLPRLHYQVRFTPTSASWINQVERWFAELTRKQLRRGVHTSTKQLETDIHAFIERHNENPKPYRWTKSADEILASVNRFCQKTERNVVQRILDSRD
jgi:hypothetical protein